MRFFRFVFTVLFAGIVFADAARAEDFSASGEIASERAAPTAEIVASRERAALLDGLRDVISRREAFFAEAETLSENERSRRAADIAERFDLLASRFSDAVPVLYFYAEFLRDGGEFSRAEKLLLRAESLEPEFVPARFLLGEIFAERGEPSKAFPRYEFAVRAAPENLAYHLTFGEFLADSRDALLAEKIFRSRDEFDTAMQDEFRAACAVAPSDLDVRVRYAESFYDVESPDWNAALAAWNVAANLLDERVPAERNSSLRAAIALHRARANAELGRFAEAEKILDAAERVPALERSRETVLKIIKDRKKTE